jgi:hypothetical protein
MTKEELVLTVAKEIVVAAIQSKAIVLPGGGLTEKDVQTVYGNLIKVVSASVGQAYDALSHSAQPPKS